MDLQRVGGLNTEHFVEPRVIHWKSFDDKTISGILYSPPARFTGKRPVIIDIHGGPEAQFQPYFSIHSRLTYSRADYSHRSVHNFVLPTK